MVRRPDHFSGSLLVERSMIGTAIHERRLLLPALARPMCFENLTAVAPTEAYQKRFIVSTRRASKRLAKQLEEITRMESGRQSWERWTRGGVAERSAESGGRA